MTPALPQHDPNLGFIWGAFGVHVGSMWVVGEQSELVTPSGEQFDPPWTDLAALLDPMLAPCWAHVGPMLAPCWRPLGILGHLGAFLERSGAHLEAISDQHRTEDERKRLDSRKIIKNQCVFVGFLKFPRFQHEAS